MKMASRQHALHGSDLCTLSLSLGLVTRQPDVEHLSFIPPKYLVAIYFMLLIRHYADCAVPRPDLASLGKGPVPYDTSMNTRTGLSANPRRFSCFIFFRLGWVAHPHAPLGCVLCLLRCAIGCFMVPVLLLLSTLCIEGRATRKNLGLGR